MGRKGSKKPLSAGAIDGKRQAPPAAAVPMNPSDSGVLKHPPGASPTAVPLSDPTRVANPSIKHNRGPWFNPGPSLYNYGFDENGCGNFSEEQLEEILINYLDRVYKEVISRLVSFGYDAAMALRAVLCKGHYYGGVDPLSNIMQNALEFLNTAAANTPDDWNALAGACSDLRHLEEYSLAAMVCLLQQISANLSRGEAIWCLLISRLRIRRASSIKFPSRSPLGNLQAASTAGAFTPGAALPFAGRQRQQEVEEEAEDVVQLVLKRLEAMRIEDEKREDKELQDQKTEMIMDLIRRIRKLEDHVKATKLWAQLKVMEAVQMFGRNAHERMVEREENQRAVNEMQVLEDSTMERRTDMQSVLKQASEHVDSLNAFVKKVEIGNSDKRDEIEAAKVLESLSTFCELIKKETKKRKKIVPDQQELAEVQEATKQAEM
ncbi:uncharacterized protein LOC110114535 isoform X2 [Dendrobium catenatum]|uniref:uncharacterized protein LOC110114535 isoform X2 n=1 Tax=Dendrobium catenatum TaxID=906689 RepID=UPI0009F1ED14|nr:uncharacterized protein LOC110114535 isoform X2 [Dendrobium catenatum]